jgi:hypothetical protein
MESHVPVDYIPRFKVEKVYGLWSARTTRLLVQGMGMLASVFAFISLAIAVALHIPAWPASIYEYGYTFAIFNTISVAFAFIGTELHNLTATLVAVVVFAALFVLNVVVFAIQLTGGIESAINLNTTPNLFGILVSAFAIVPSFVTFTGTLALYILIRDLTTPSSGRARDYAALPRR